MSRALAALALATLLAACGGEQKSTPPAEPAPVTPPSAPAEPPPTPTTPSPAPAPEPSAPSGSLRGNADAGAALYRQYCVTCHGPGGKGDGPVAATLNPKPANHTDHVYMASLSDEYLYKVISKGGAAVGKSPMMAPWGGVINDQGLKDLIGFLRRLSSS